jgi:uncharacterized damage-inducible protein DinB
VNITDYLRRQFAYDAWANREVLQAIHAAGSPSERSLQLLSHILAAERVWLERLRRQPQSVPVWPEPSLAYCEAEAAELARLCPEYLDTADLSEPVAYKNTKGEGWTSAAIDIITQVLFHAAYHRGQIATNMRANGQTPAYSDFIHGLR